VLYYIETSHLYNKSATFFSTTDSMLQDMNKLVVVCCWNRPWDSQWEKMESCMRKECGEKKLNIN